MSPNILPRKNQRKIQLFNLCSLFICSRHIGMTVLGLIIFQKHLVTPTWSRSLAAKGNFSQSYQVDATEWFITLVGITHRKGIWPD